MHYLPLACFGSWCRVKLPHHVTALWKGFEMKCIWKNSKHWQYHHIQHNKPIPDREVMREEMLILFLGTWAIDHPLFALSTTYQWISGRKMQLQCICTEVMSFLHETINIATSHIKRPNNQTTSTTEFWSLVWIFLDTMINDDPTGNEWVQLIFINWR